MHTFNYLENRYTYGVIYNTDMINIFIISKEILNGLELNI